MQHPDPQRMAYSAPCHVLAVGATSPSPFSLPPVIILHQVLSGENSAGNKLTRKMMGTALIPLIIGILATPAIIIEGWWRNIFAEESALKAKSSPM